MAEVHLDRSWNWYKLVFPEFISGLIGTKIGLILKFMRCSSG